MPRYFRVLLLSIAAASLPTRLEAQVIDSTGKLAIGSITGRVTLSTDPAIGVRVVLLKGYGSDRRPVAKGTTDADGRYLLTGIAGGSYRLKLLAPGYVRSESSIGGILSLREGERLSGIDFELARGGVITGRITDADGYPAIAEEVVLQAVDQEFPVFFSNGWMNLTDDRGVYRLYGVPAGRYTVSVGERRDKDGAALSGGESKRPRTFYPGVTEKPRASIIEVHEGGEIFGIDITVGKFSKSFTASGRLISEETGAGVPGASCGAVILSPAGDVVDFTSSSRTNSNGDFWLTDLRPGQYIVQISGRDRENFYADPVPFQIDHDDVGGLEVKLRRGSSIRGTVLIEGANAGAMRSSLSEITIRAGVEFLKPSAGWSWGSSHVADDGSFLIQGLAPGTARFSISATPGSNFRPELHYLEHDGAVASDGIELGPGEDITAVRVVLVVGTSTLQGQVKLVSGPVLRGLRFGLMTARNLGNGLSLYFPIDDRGHFFVDNLPAGQYELSLQPFFVGMADSASSEQRLPMVKQTVNVGERTKLDVTLSLDLSAVPGQNQ